MIAKKKTQDMKQNALGIKLYCTIMTLIFLAYFIEILKDGYSLLHYLVFVGIFAVSLITLFVTMRRNPESKRIRLLIAIFYGLTYVLYLFTTTSPLVFTYAIPGILLCVVFYDFKFSIFVNCAVVFINIAVVVYHAIAKNVTMVDVEIQLIMLVVVCVFSVLTTQFTVNTNNARLRKIEKEKDQINKTAEKVMETADHMTSDINEAVAKMDSLKESITKTKNGMSDINKGISDTATAVQEQLYKTEDIQKQVDLVSQNANSIAETVGSTGDSIREGMKIMETMMEFVQNSQTAGGDVQASLSKLQSVAEAMKQIVSMITTITSKTSLLALNASIEAARAGDAGRGFAVVANEVNSLAVQTQTATVDISKLIDEINSQVATVVANTDVLLKNNNEQIDSARQTSEKLSEIETGSRQINENTKSLSDAITLLQTANNEIINNISSVSAVSEEVAAQANVSFEEASNNLAVVDDVMNLVTRLDGSARNLNNIKVEK